jgi:hypothetical protein
MPRSRPRLTATIEAAIVAYIRAGGYPHVAAEAAGVPLDLFEHWLQKGQSAKGAALYRRFHAAVQEAKAQARLAAETAALKNKPIDWLKSGPGKETAVNAGWTTAARPGGSSSAAAEDVLGSAPWQGLLQELLEALAPFPEARVAVARALDKLAQADVH